MSQLEWNGTYIGKITKQNIEQIVKFKGDTYWKLNYNNIKLFVLAKSSKNLYPCIIDELKPIFHIPKLGTHYCHLGSRLHILIRVISHTINDISVDIKLNEINYNDLLFSEKVKNIFAFRELLGITVTTGNSIRIRRFSDDSKGYDSSESLERKSGNDLDYWDPVSFREPNFAFEKSIISKNTLKRIFNNDYKHLIKYTHHLLGIVSKNDLKTVLTRMSNIFEKVINRVDKNSGWILNELLMRFNSFF